MLTRPGRRTLVASLAVAAAVTALVVAGALSGARPHARQAQPLNVVLLVIDDTRWDALGAAGNRVIRTPRLDLLASEGVRFANAYVTTAICMTSRASIFTGQYMSRHGIDAFGKAIPPAAWTSTYPAVLRRAGYWSGFVGKYGVGAARDGDFDFLRSYETRHWMKDAGGRDIHITEQNTQHALEFLRTRPSDRPFLLNVSFFAAHAEDAAPEQYLPQAWSESLYRGVMMPPPLRGEARYLAALPDFLRQPSNEGRIRYGWRFDTPARYQDYLTRYYRLISEVDAGVGRIVDELRFQGVLDRTLIVFIGDNGYFQGDRGLADKWYPYEESIRVPLVIRDPRLPAVSRGRVVQEMALNIDVAPTIVSAAGIALPPVIQGERLDALYLGRTRPRWRDEFFYEHPTITNKDRIPTSHAVVRRDWKFVSWPEFNTEQFFDLTSDPGEVVNLVDVPASRPRVEAARKQLAAWQARVH
jgi:arylsulfatase